MKTINIVDSELTQPEISHLEDIVDSYVNNNRIYIDANVKRGNVNTSIGIAIKHGWKQKTKFDSPVISTLDWTSIEVEFGKDRPNMTLREIKQIVEFFKSKVEING